jgi:phage-related minor tail protein
MSKREKDIFQITKSIGDEETGFAYDVIGKLLSDQTEEDLRKEMALVREDAQVEILRRDKINNDHQKLNGELRSDNKKLTKQIEDFLDKKVNGLRKGGVL